MNGAKPIVPFETVFRALEPATPDWFPSSYVHLIQYIIALCIL
jgi:hypothetical protein